MKQVLKNNQYGFIPLVALLALGVLALVGFTIFQAQIPFVSVVDEPSQPPVHSVSYEPASSDKQTKSIEVFSKEEDSFKSTSSESSQGKVAGLSTTNSQVPLSLDEDYLNKLIYDNIVNAKESGLFGDLQPLQAVPNNNSFSPPIGLPTVYSPISYYQPPQPSSQGGGSVFAATQLSSKTFTTNTATISESLTVNGASSINGNLTIAGTINPGLTAGSVVFQGASGLAQDNANFYWDDTRNSLGIGTVTPSALVSVAGSSGVGTGNITASSGTSVTGTGTAFTTQLKVGDVIVVNGQPRTVATIASDTSLTTTTAFSPALTATPSVSYVNTATTNTGSTESNTLTWNHYVDSTVENRMLIVAVATHKNAALVIPDTSTVTYGGQAMTRLGSHGTSTNTGINFFYLVAPPTGTNQIVVTLSSSATARIVAQSVLLANVNQSAVFNSNQSGGGTSNLLGGAGFGSTTRQGLITVGSFEANITADIDEDGTVTGAAPSTELGNLSTGSTSSDARLVISFAHLLNSPPFYGTFTAFVLSGSTSYVYKSPTVNNATTATGAFVYRSSFLSVKDSVSYEQIKIGGDGQASFHNGISVDLLGSYGYNNYAALFNGGFVGIGTTTPTNELSVTGDADFSGTLGVAGGAVDPNIGINIESSAAYGGGGVYKYGVSVDLEATDNSSVFGGSFVASSSTSGGLPDHPILIGVQAATYHTGTGRIDVAEGFGGVVQNVGGGWVNEAYGAHSQVLNSGASSYINVSHGVYSDTVNTSSTTAISLASAFEGKIRTLSGGTAGYTTAIGLNLSNWSTPGAAVGTSYGIYMNNSIDIGTTRYALYSSAASSSYFFGNVGIGTPTPAANLQVAQSTDGAGTVSNTDGGTTVTGVGTQFLNTFKVGDMITIDPTGVSPQTVQVVAIASNTSMTTEVITAAHIAKTYTLAGGTRLSVQGNGYVGVGAVTPAYKLDVLENRSANYIAHFFNDGNNQDRYGIQIQGGADDASGTTYYLNALDGDGTQVGYIANTAGTFALTDVSDIRTKTNIQDTQVAGLETLLQLRVVDFNRLANPDGPLLTGFIAQEVQAVYPNIVTEGENGYLGITKENLIPVIVKAIQEQQAQINILIDPDSQLQGNLAGNLSNTLSVTPKSHLFLSVDSLGQARILSGSTTVRVSFSKPYEYQPIVSVTPRGRNALNNQFRYVVIDEDTNGFTIEIDQPLTDPIEFNWNAFPARYSKLTVSDGTTEDIVIIVSQVSSSSPSNLDQGTENLEEAAPIEIDSPIPELTSEPEDLAELQPTTDVIFPDQPTSEPEAVVEPVPEPVAEPIPPAEGA